MTEEFTKYESDVIRERLAKYTVIVPDDVEFFWCDFWLSGTNGMFKPKNKIYMRAKDKLVILDGVADDVICHELVHYWQYQYQGWFKYSMLNLSKVNEKEAYAEQERVRAIIEG